MPPYLVYRWRPPVPPHDPIVRALDLAENPTHTVNAQGLTGVGPGQSYISDDLPAGAMLVAGAHELAAQAPKPPYRIPSMEQIREVAWNGRNVISLFCGGGGSSTGYRMAGYRILVAVEFVPAAADTYRRNAAPHTRILRRDVRHLTTAELLAVAGLKVGELDVLDGSPPCEPFSSAGQREASWGREVAYSGQRQRTDDLFLQFARVVREAQPRVFVAENVTGLVKGAAKGYFKMIMAALRACGYRVQARTLDAARLGVPQHRQRVIIQGVREDLGRDPAWPAPLPYVYTVRDALPHLGRMGTDPGFDQRRTEHLSVEQMMIGTDRPSPAITATGHRRGPRHGDPAGGTGIVGTVEEATIERRIGGSIDAPTRGGRTSLDEPAPTLIARNGGPGGRTNGLFVNEPAASFHRNTGGSNQTPDRDRIDEPAPTITNGGAPGSASTHYQVEEPSFYRDTMGQFGGDPARNRIDEPAPTVLSPGGGAGTRLEVTGGPRRRKLTIPELKALCGFPPDYRLVGTFGQQWERLGDCVTPPMAAAVGAAILRDILDE